MANRDRDDLDEREEVEEEGRGDLSALPRIVRGLCLEDREL